MTDSRSRRTRASRRGRHRQSTDSKPIVQNGVPDRVSTQEPLCPVPASTRPDREFLRGEFHAPTSDTDGQTIELALADDCSC